MRGVALRKDDGYSLVEIVVVVAVIAILLTLAIPLFMGARYRAQDRAAQAQLRDVLTTAKVIYVDEETYTAATPGPTGSLHASQPSLRFVPAGHVSTSDDVISVASDEAMFRAAAQSASGRCWYARDVATVAGGLAWAVGAVPSGGCRAASAPNVDDPAWVTDPAEALIP